MSQSPNTLHEHVRRRPGMYIGGTDQRALNCCVLEVIANSIEEHLAGRGCLITVTIHNDGSLSVRDVGGGISVAPYPEHKIPFIELSLTTHHVPDNYLKRPYRVLGLCGVGTKCVNAVSEWMQVNTVWEGKEYQISFAQGRVAEPLRQVTKQNLDRGTVVRFKPDPGIFKALTFERNFLSFRLDHLAVLHPDLSFALVDERPNSTGGTLISLYHYPNGIADFLEVMCTEKMWKQAKPLVLNGEAGDIKISLGFQFAETANVSVLSFVNSSPTSRDGTHVKGFFEGLREALNAFSKPDSEFQLCDLRTGINAFVAIWLNDPHYGGATKDEIINPEVETAVRELTHRGVAQWAAQSGEQARWLIHFLDHARRAKNKPCED